MKKIFIFLALLFFYGGLFSQVDTQNTTEEHQAMFSEIDKSKITTGILYDRVIPFSGIEKYNGKNKSVICKQSTWKQMYYELQNASYEKDTVNMPGLDFIFGTKRQFTDGKLIPIYLLNYKYNKIKENAFDDELLLMQNGKITENPATNENPYETNRVFAAAPYKTHTYYGNDFAFIFNGNYLYTNTNEKITNLFADFDDGFGFRKIEQGRELHLSYAETGQKTISVKAITQNNDTLITKFAFEVKAKSVPDYTITRFETDDILGSRCFCLDEYYYIPCQYSDDCSNLLIEYLSRKGGSLYHFKSPHTPNIIENSILIVEGFDLEDNTFAEELYEKFNKQKLADCILDNNYDIFIANYDIPTDYIGNNAVFVENVIDYINSIKGNKTELVIAGASMGGLTTRYALTSMEQKGKDTQTRLWISFDSPQKGANIPLGIQYWLKEFNILTGGEADEMINILRKPGAKQMLIYHFDYYPNTAPEFTAFYNDINNKGYPQTCRNIAITNGASNGTGQGYSSGSKILEFIYDTWYIKKRTITAWAVPDGGSNYVIAQYKKGNNVKKEYKVSNTLPVDVAPGSFSPTMKEIQNAIEGADHVEISAIHDNHSFIPAISALALNTNDYFYDFYHPSINQVLNKTPFDMVYFPKEDDDKNISQPHVWVSHETAENILKELYPDNIHLPNADWQQGEMQAVTSIHITNGFHASAGDMLHLHTGSYINNLINEEWTEDDKQNKTYSNKNTTSNIKLPETENITVYPNPSNGIFNINIKNNNFSLSTFNFQLTDLTGKIVYLKNNIKQNNIQINISDKPSGIYILKINYGNKIISRKIIKQ